MNFPFYIARRYLFSKKSTHAINIISGISVFGVAVATTALVVTLSVFNGFHDLVASFFTSFDPQLKVVPAKGKAAPANDPVLTQIKQMEEVAVATECVEDQAMAVFNHHQAMVKVKGMDDNFAEQTDIKDILYGDGGAELEIANLQFGIPGIRLAQDLGCGTRWNGYLYVLAPKRQGQIDATSPNDAFVIDSLLSTGCVFNVKQTKYDKNYILAPISLARHLFGQEGNITSLELRLKKPQSTDRVKKKIKELGGSRFQVLDRYEQQADTFKIMNVEKFIAYIFLTFILVVVCFNIIGSLSMLIIDKNEDTVTLRNLGADNRQISRIFLLEGRMIAVIGAILGIAIGLLLCWAQQTFGLVALGDQSGTFVIDAYPVSVHFWDIVIVFLTVIAAGWLAVWYTVRSVRKIQH